ncbi:MAG: hypothetical protein JWR89_1200 [Tardiphaga sp.]|jgi:VanZ family protein|uniref:VanZ family protein n=1 Tax=Tardiphaga sp. TaxID=1926292 RepID=UPI00261C02EB|nr:VanZ family protein [Tardiphaga sp.]MDB5501298.1 hypothetical protein [Tardiphaga sp.]
MVQKLLIALVCICIAGIAAVTLAQVGLRPHLFSYPSLDRVFAFAVLGLLLGLALPRRLPMVLAVLIAGAIALELLQFVRADRDPRFFDAIAKIVGAVAGVGVAWGLAEIMRRRRANAG